MKKVLILAIALLVVGGGGTVGALYFLHIGPFAREVAPPPPEVVGVKPPRFIEMAPMTVTLFAGSRVSTIVQVQLDLETDTAGNQDLIEKLKPKLRDAFLRDLYSFIPRLVEANQKLDVAIIRERLEIIGNRAAGADIIKGVLIQSLTTQRY